MNLPNQITIGRLFLTMIFVVLAGIPADWPNAMLCWKTGYIISIIAGFTDFFDGYLARKYKLITTFGKLMDPLTDKIFTISAFVVLADHRVVPAWIVILILTREFAVTGLRALAANRGEVIEAAFIGKFKTVAQMLVLLLGGLLWVEWLPRLPWIEMCWHGILAVLALFTMYTGVEYFVKNKHLYMDDL